VTHLPLLLEPFAGGVSFQIRVTPRSSRPGIAGTRDGVLLVRVKAAPVEGVANQEIVDVIARALDVPRRRVTIESGERGRLKRIRVSGIDARSAGSLLTREGLA
jgi:uncharacterized protein (TIGR00251 family)